MPPCPDCCPEFVTQDLRTLIVVYKSEIVDSEQKYFFKLKIIEIANRAKITKNVLSCKLRTAILYHFNILRISREATIVIKKPALRPASVKHLISYPFCPSFYPSFCPFSYPFFYPSSYSYSPSYLLSCLPF